MVNAHVCIGGGGPSPAVPKPEEVAQSPPAFEKSRTFWPQVCPTGPQTTGHVVSWKAPKVLGLRKIASL